MCKNQTTLMSNKREQLMRCGLAALIIAMFSALVATSGILPVMAAEAAAPILITILDTVLGIVKLASIAVGIVVVIWGVFQIIMALRREDSEGVSKQITTIAVGGVLVGFGALIQPIYEYLMGMM